MKKVFGLAAIGSLLAAIFFLAVQPVRAENMDTRISALEQELARLKGEQIEMREETTAAKSKLPSFKQRPTSGLKIEGPGRAWSINFRMRYHAQMLFRAGDSSERSGQGEVFNRRVRPEVRYCYANCLYEVEFEMDWDGNDTDITRAGTPKLQRAVVHINMQKINPWLPEFYFGNKGGAGWSRRRSSSSDAKLDYDIISRSHINTGSWDNGWGLNWRNIPLKSIGIPGRIGWFNFVRAHIEPGQGEGNFTDKVDYIFSTGIEPFRNLKKNKWLKGIEVSFGAWFCNADDNAKGIACEDIRLRETDGPDRATLWRADHSGPFNNGQKDLHELGLTLKWKVGPYTLRTHGDWIRLDGSDGDQHARGWEITHQLFVWSPKGFLTGSSTTPGSLLVGWSFERADGYCESGSCSNGGEYDSNHLILRQLSAFYFLLAKVSAGVVWNWWDAKKVRTGDQETLGCRRTGVAGRGCDWHNVMLVFRFEY